MYKTALLYDFSAYIRKLSLSRLAPYGIELSLRLRVVVIRIVFVSFYDYNTIQSTSFYIGCLMRHFDHIYSQDAAGGLFDSCAICDGRLTQ